MNEERMAAIIDIVRKLKKGKSSVEEAEILQAVEGSFSDLTGEDRSIAKKAYELSK